MNYGLKLKTEDPRDLKLGSVYNLPTPKSLPKKFRLNHGIKTKDQKNSDFCAAFASCSVSEIQEGVELCPEWLFAVAKKLEGGNPDSFGLELRTVCKAHQKYGCIKKKDSPFSLENKDASFLRRIENWPDELYDKALEHKKGSFFDVTGPYDPFDDIRVAMHNLQNGVLIGVVWSWDKSEVFIDYLGVEREGHALAAIDGWDGEYLILRNSWGDDAGQDGEIYVHRDIINKFVNMYGAYMFLDISKEEAEEYIKYGRKINSLKVTLMQKALDLAKELLSIMTKKKEMKPKKNLIDAIIQVESGGDDHAIGDKHLSQKAYGPMQIRQPAVDDVNRVFKTKYKAQDMLGNRELSKWVFEKYMSIYATEKQIGRPVTDEDRARCWNGGPTGWKRQSTVGYWAKVKKHLE